MIYFTMENLFTRMKSLTSSTALSFVLLSGLVACSSRNGAVSNLETSDKEEMSSVNQDDSSFVLGDSSADSSKDEVVSIDQEGLGDLNSLPVKHSKKSRPNQPNTWTSGISRIH